MIHVPRRHSVRTMIGGERPTRAPRPPRTQRPDLDALRSAARRLGVDACELRASEYRLARSRDPRLPAEASIRVAFGSWQRARERVAGEARR